MATLVHQQLGGNMNFFTDYTRIHDVLSKVGELTEKDDKYGVLPAGDRTRPGMNVEILREERYSGASSATAMQRSWGRRCATYPFPLPSVHDLPEWKRIVPVSRFLLATVLLNLF